MRPWMPTAIAAGIVIGVVARRLWFAARRQTPLVVGTVDPGTVLGALASVTSSTVIAIIGRDLSYLAASPAWRAMLAKWLRAGAKIRYLVAARDARGEELFGTLARAQRGSAELLVLANEAVDSQVARAYGAFHFAAFENPAQLWLEGRHESTAAIAEECEFVSDARLDPRWAARREDFDALASNATSVDLAGGAA
jgi:hypothetical protein